MRPVSILVVLAAILTGNSEGDAVHISSSSHGLNCPSDLSHGDSVTQSLPSVVRTKGDEVTLSCTYETTVRYDTFYWYQQRRDTQPEFILWKYSDGSESKASFAEYRFSAELQTSKKFTSLTISGLQLSDTAMYYCALLDDTMMRNSLAPVQKVHSTINWLSVGWSWSDPGLL
ncbi:hypothetical protein chiPu_0019013 [Chiloscyllium punctatum]|uniref:Ig-like domain-containing protein n=1 Tax=Chiloscyllium punctatum TaxID=137246 RepID=A0A401RQL7_CHIPU|nr:hypothetical protein [Chiloscyllium punctatum]